MNINETCNKLRGEMGDVMEGLRNGTITPEAAKAKNAAAAKTLRALNVELQRQRSSARSASGDSGDDPL